MTERKPFLLRIDAGLYAALARWADDETRSLNGQIEALLRRAVEADGRFAAEDGHPRQLSAPLGRQSRPASREPVPQPHGRGHIPRRPSSPASRPQAGDRAPRRLPKPVPPAPRPAVPPPVSPVPKPAALQAAELQPAAARPPQRIPADSWDAMED